MTTRDEYIAKMKTQLDAWNVEMAKWEEKAKTAQADMKPEIDRQMALLKEQGEKARYQMKLLQAAAGDAWMDMSKGADEAWAAMRDAFDKASTHFKK
jgi:hypothetical protein